MGTDIGEVVRESGLAFWEGEPDCPWSVIQDVNEWEAGAIGTTCYDRLEMLLRAVTLDKFILSANMMRGWNQVRDFFGVVKDVYEDRQWWMWDGCGPPWEDARVVEEFMSQCIDIARRSGVFYPAGWLRILTEVRAMINPSAFQQPRDPLTGRVLVRAPRPSRRAYEAARKA